MSIHFVPGLLDKKEWDAFAEILNTPIYIKTYCSPSSGIIGSLFRSLALCRCMEKPLQFVALKHGVIFLLSHICSIYRRNRNNPQEVSGRIESVLNYLDCNLSRPLSLEDVSREFNITPNHLNRVFREATKIPLHRYLQNRRLQLAKTKIENGYTAEEAAFQSGFNDYSSFFRAYKRCYGTAPSGAVRNRGDATTWGADGEKPDGTTGGDTSSATRHC
jgi:AraC-like DNA-binding protein